MTQPTSCIELHKFGAVSHLCEMVKHIPGPAIEVGVYTGGMAYHMAKIMPERKLYLVDTFKGIPHTCSKDNWFPVGYFGDVNLEKVRETFSEFSNVEILQGVFPDDFIERFDKEMFAVIHLDVDVYRSYKDGLEYLYPRTHDGGMILLDDYLCHVCGGCTIACDEFVISRRLKGINNHGGQYYFTKGDEWEIIL